MGDAMNISELETPAVIVDVDIMQRNLERAAQYANQHGLRLRPHTKTHKSPAIARMQLQLGAAGLTVAKVGEAEVMIKAEPKDLLVAYPVIGRSKLARLMEVARSTRVSVALDSVFAARQLSDAAREAQVVVGVLVEFDAGLHRVGVTTNEELLQLARSVEKLPRLTLDGIAFYPGHIKSLDDGGQEAFDEVSAMLQSVLDDFKRAGIEVQVVSGGSTPLLFHSHKMEGLTEIRPGTYVYNDLNTLRCGACSLDDCAAWVLATVISTARNGYMIIDGGSKTFSSDRLAGTSEVSYGRFEEAPEAVLYNMNEEHGYVDIRKTDREFTVGDRVRVIPNHVCTTMNMHDSVYGIRGDQVVTEWRVEARGKLR